ncbi:hypothetical protein CJF30_00006514 [Rutstroemia sp. NJR-2017a BBW]|nr:hypothetical protein CJF30_00006514 [Rutstroemia sp. NJR-2017a BBW]
MSEVQESSPSKRASPVTRPEFTSPFSSEQKAPEQPPTEGSPQVRFASANEEIAPNDGFTGLQDNTTPKATPGEDQAGLGNLSVSLQGTQLQERRMSRFAFEPVSLPASRVPSTEDNSREPSRYNTHTSSNRQSPHQSPRPSSMHSPPITPAATRSRDAPNDAKGAPLEKVDAEEDPTEVTPQISPPGTSPSTTNADESRPGSSGQATTRPTSHSTESSGGQAKSHGAFSIGPTTNDASVPQSREPSPTRSSATSVYSRPFTPAGDLNDPYAASKRLPQPKNADGVEARFKFTAIGAKNRSSPSSSSTNLPRSSRAADGKAPGQAPEKRHTGLFGHKDHLSRVHDDSASTIHKSHGSMSELKRFLKIGGHHKAKRSGSPTPSSKSGSGTKTPPHHKTPQLPFGDDHGLTSRYGKFGKVLGAGAGGSVRLMKRSTDGTTFAVKEFRARHSYESEREYAKKVTAEFCVGSTLHHGNIIETLDIVHEKGKWYEVMEYAPYDLFAIVMTGKMSREEVSCSFLQILSGVTYLHSMGLAHRDLKLDNVVVNEHGIMKIIDFGSASVFKYPFEGGITLASGIVGSDPYLAPEVYDERKYDPQPADIWSLAIIFCCMSLRRFPWKMPRMTDNSYKLFASPPSPGTDMKKDPEENSKAASAKDSTTNGQSDAKSTHSKSNYHPQDGCITAATFEAIEKKTDLPKDKPEVIKGPWRLLRLLPRESRHIIGRMLELDPRKRATMSEILDDHWVNGTEICRQEEGGKVIRAQGHTHTLEPPSSQPPAK